MRLKKNEKRARARLSITRILKLQESDFDLWASKKDDRKYERDVSLHGIRLGTETMNGLILLFPWETE